MELQLISLSSIVKSSWTANSSCCCSNWESARSVFSTRSTIYTAQASESKRREVQEEDEENGNIELLLFLFVNWTQLSSHRECVCSWKLAIHKSSPSSQHISKVHKHKFQVSTSHHIPFFPSFSLFHNVISLIIVNRRVCACSKCSLFLFIHLILILNMWTHAQSSHGFRRESSDDSEHTIRHNKKMFVKRLRISFSETSASRLPHSRASTKIFYIVSFRPFHTPSWVERSLCLGPQRAATKHTGILLCVVDCSKINSNWKQNSERMLYINPEREREKETKEWE